MKNFKTDDSAFVDFVNDEILQIAQLSNIPLGPLYADLNDSDIQNNLAIYRMTDKFERPNASNSKIRKDATINEAVIYDADGVVDFNPAKMVLDPQIRRALYETRNLLATVTDGYAFDVGLVEITTGETFVSARGDTSILAKLRDQHQWCVTPECFNLFAATAYRVPALKKQVRYFYYRSFIKHLKRYLYMVKNSKKFLSITDDDLGCKQKRRALLNKASTYFWKRTHSQNLGVVYLEHKDSRDVGFRCFKHMLKSVVTFVGGTRFTTVPKNNEKDRVIECEALCNMIVQRVVAAGIRKIISINFKIDLSVAQSKHQAIISRMFDMISTIDLKNASNSNWMAVIRWLYAKSRLLNHVENSRCSHVKTGEDWHFLNMVAPMGNGFTFELMTLTLLACCRNLDDTSRVYGDDIIVARGKAPLLVDLLSVLGYRLNTAKTFFTGNFRESCGGFVSRTHTFLSYEFRWAEDLFDAIVLVNKIRNLISRCSGHVLKTLTGLYGRILKVAPLLCCCGVKDGIVPLEGAIYVPSSTLKRLQQKDQSCRDLHKLLLAKYGQILTDYQIKGIDASPGLRVSKKSTTYADAPLVVRDPHWISYYLYGGRVTKPSRRREIVTVETGLYLGTSANFLI